MLKRNSKWLAAAFALAVAHPAAHSAYRLTDPDPLNQSITDIPLTGFNPFDPGASTGTARRAAVAFDGGATGGVHVLAQTVFSPDPTTATSLGVAAGSGAHFGAGQLVRVGRTGELLRVQSVVGDVITVARAQLGSVGAALMDGDALTIISKNTSFVCWYFCEQSDTAPRSTIWELDRRNTSTATFALSLSHAPGGWSVDARAAGAAPLALDLPFDPRGRWLLISLAHANETTSPADELFLSVFDPASGQMLSTSAPFAEAARAARIPDAATIGDRFAVGSGPARSALGICIPAIVADAVVDGRTLPSGLSTISCRDLALNAGLSGHVSLHRFDTCAWAANYSAGGFGGAANDAREGIANGALHVFDRASAFFGSRHQADPGTSIYGGAVSVDPYTFGEGTARVARPAFDAVVSPVALPATQATLDALGGPRPSGLAGSRTRRFAAALADGTALDRLRVGIFGNSRAVYPYGYPLRLSDGTFAGRECRTNFVDMGIVGQSPLYDNGRLVGHIGPVPWCNWTNPDQPVGGYGADCSLELPRCTANTGASPVVVAPSVAMSSLVNTTLGSRFGIFSPVATRVPAVGFPGLESLGSLDNYRGNHAAVRLKPRHSARFMVQPEIGLPVTDPLVVTMYVLNHPSSASLTARAVRAPSQGSEESWSAPVDAPALGGASEFTPPALKPITSVLLPRLADPATVSRAGSVTVSDLDGAFAAIAVGDMVQVFDPAGAGSPYDEAFIVREITRFANGNLRLSYDWLPRQFPAVGDSITFIKGNEIFRKVQVELAPCGPDEWRGLEISAGADGDGVVLWGFGFENPARNGIVTVPIGRSGCGAWLQYNRWPVQTPLGGTSLFQRILSELHLDVAVLTSADQGTPSGYHVQAYERVIEALQYDSRATEVVLYATGPEYASEDTRDKSDAFDKYSLCAAMQLAAANKSVPMTSFYFDPEYRSSAFGRIESGVDTTESATHPGTVLDVSMLARQILSLSAAPPVVDPPALVVCPSASAVFAVPPSPEVHLEYRWEIQDAPGVFTTLVDGPLVRNGAAIATVSGAATHQITFTDMHMWEAASWPIPGRSAVRCTEVRPSSTLTSAAADFAVCPTDLDCANGTDGDDVLQFFAWWDLADPRADFNADGGVDGDDVIAFFARWDAGC